MINDDEKRKIAKFKEDCSRLEGEGYRLQDEGKEIVRFAQQGKKTADFLFEEYPKYKKMSFRFPEASAPFGQFGRWVDAADRRVEESLELINKSKPFLLQAVSVSGTAVTTTSSLTRIFHLGASLVELKNPDINIKSTFELRDPNEVLGRRDTTEVSTLLNTVDPKLNEMRRGAWDALVSSSPDRFAQAAHSMREVLTKLISKYASNADVKKCAWWTYDDEGEEGVSIRQRLRLLIYGPEKEPTDSEEIDLLDDRIKRYNSAYKYLKSIAHGSSKPTAVAIEAHMTTVEDLVVLLLRRRKEES